MIYFALGVIVLPYIFLGQPWKEVCAMQRITLEDALAYADKFATVFEAVIKAIRMVKSALD